jgi:hypothetical protein
MRTKRVVLFVSVAATAVALLQSPAAATDPPAVTDTTAPTVSLLTPGANASYAQNAVVKASYSCNDTGGSGLATCTGTYPNGATLPTQTLGTKDFTVFASDGAGNITKVTRTYTVVDKTAPTITISSPAAGATYEQNSALEASFDCNDNPAGAGIDTCVGTVADGSPISTATVGTKSFTVTARDLAGNQTTKTVSYRVAAPAPTIKVTAPNGGQVWARGVSHTITWSATNMPGVARLRIQVLKGAAIVTTVSSSALPSAGSIGWTPSLALATGADYRVKITVLNVSPSIFDTSDGPFALN